MINIKSQQKKILSLVLCGTLICSAVGAGAYAAGTKNTANNNNTTDQEKTAVNETSSTQTATKDETVYVIAGADGSVKKVIVSDWIKNSLESASLTDKTDLENIANVKGNESYSINSNNMKVWDAEGNDIYYTGDINKEIPVDVNISYTLDGKNVTADKLAGASGQVTMRFDYKNNQYEMVDIDGTQEKIYVPFAMLTGMMLDNDKFSNVRVSNGKVINDGSHTIVAGLAFPGLSDNLQIDTDKIEIPDYVEITADVKDFELTTTLTMATNEIFNEVDLGDSSSMDELEDKMNQLTDAMGQLIDGSAQLYDALSTLLDKSNQIVDYINQFADASKQLASGAAEVNSGVGDLQGYMATLKAGLNQLAGNNEQLNGGAKQVFETLLSTAQTQLTAAGLTVPELTIENYDEVLDGVIKSLDKDNVYQQALDTVTAKVEENRPAVVAGVTAVVQQQVQQGVEAYAREQVVAGAREQVVAGARQQVEAGARQQVEAGVRQQVLAAVLASQGMTVDQYNALPDGNAIKTAINSAVDVQMGTDAVKQQIETIMASDDVKNGIEAKMASDDVKNGIEAKMASDEIRNQIAAGVAQKMASDEIKQTINDNVEAKIQSLISENMQSTEVQTQLGAAAAGLTQVSSLKSSLDSYNQFYTGLLTYTAGVADAAYGAAQITDGAALLKKGTETLSSKSGEFSDKFGQFQSQAGGLVDGVAQIKDGSMQLSDSLKKFDEEGIEKLKDAVDGDLGKLATRFKATIDVSKDYKSFAGISDDMDGKVRFIYKTDEIKKSEN